MSRTSSAPTPPRRSGRDLAPARLALRLSYTQAVQEAGGLAVVLPAHGYVDDTDALLAGARERDLPVLGICHGMQALNVARGGSLRQHLPDVTALAHRQDHDPFVPAHSVTVGAQSLLHRLTGAPALPVNSFHHQAADRVGAGLEVCAEAPDGTIEALWDPSARFLLGVQWHPELLTHRPEQAGLFTALIAAAAGAVAPLALAA